MSAPHCGTCTCPVGQGCAAMTRPTWWRPVSVQCSKAPRYRIGGKGYCGTHARQALGLKRSEILPSTARVEES